VVVVACEPGEQLRRLMSRDGLTEQDARARLDAQWPIAEKEARADYVISTDGTATDTDAQVRTVHEQLLADN
jgi:dephospho-CoA kinase